MLEKFKINMFHIGVFIFCLTLFFEHLFWSENNITCFIKGFASGLELVGIIILFMNKNKK